MKNSRLETPRVYAGPALAMLETRILLLRTHIEELLMRVLPLHGKACSRDIEELKSALPCFVGMTSDRPEWAADELKELQKFFGSHESAGPMLNEQIQELDRQTREQRRFEASDPVIRDPRGPRLRRDQRNHRRLSALRLPIMLPASVQ